MAAEVPGVVDANIEQQMERPQLDIRPRRDMLAYYGIPMSQFADFIRVALAGETVSQVYEKGRPFDLVLKMESDARGSIDQVASLAIDSPKGKIPLSAVADVRSTAGPNSINRENVSRRIVISANVEGRDLRGVVNDIMREVDEEIDLPEGYYVNYGGQFESRSKCVAHASHRVAPGSCDNLPAALRPVSQRRAVGHHTPQHAARAHRRNTHPAPDLGRDEHPGHHRIHIAHGHRHS